MKKCNYNNACSHAATSSVAGYFLQPQADGTTVLYLCPNHAQFYRERAKTVTTRWGDYPAPKPLKK